mgnify:CR=1 FL=1
MLQCLSTAGLVQGKTIGIGSAVDGHDTAQPAFDLDVALHDDGVGQKCRAVRAEAQIGVAVFEFRRQ